MPQPEYISAEQLAALLSIERPRVCELVAVHWPAPTGARYYASSQYDELPGYELLRARGLAVEARFPGERFRDVPFSSGLGDERVDLDFSDLDGRLRGLYSLHGPGVRVEVFYYFPEIDWMPSVWFGHLQPPDGASAEVFKCKAAAGFRSAQLPCPRRMLGFRGCQALFGGKLDDLALVAMNDCWYDRHLGGGFGNLDPATGLPYHDCPRNVIAACIARLEPAGATRAPQYLASDTVVETIVNRQTKGSTLFPAARGNQTNLTRPLRVIFGLRRVRDLDLLAYLPQHNNNDPNKGFVRVVFAVSEGRLRAMWECRVNDVLVGLMHLNVRLGGVRQAPTFFTPNVSNYSGTAHFYAVHGWVNPAALGPSQVSGSCMVEGLDDIKVYSAPGVFTREYTTNRAWCLRRVLSDRRWGYGLDEIRLDDAEWIDLAGWCDEAAGFTDPQGQQHLFTRSTFNAELTEGSVQQQVDDICRAGRFGRPFQQVGLLRVLPLRKVALDDPDDPVPVFSEDDHTIYAPKGKSSLTYTDRRDDRELANRVVVTFDDAAHDWLEHPLTFEDVDAQLRAGAAFGDHTQRVVEKKYSLRGVTNYWEAAWLGNLLLDLGEFDEGGLRNYLEIKFTTWFRYALPLHRYKVIRVLGRATEPFGFEYFRVKSIRRKPDLKVEITAQAYPADYYELMEALATPLPHDTGGEGDGLFGTPRGGRPEEIPFSLLTHGPDSVTLRFAENAL